MAKLIGTGTNQVPTNGMLGGMAFQTPEDVTVEKIQENDFNVVTQTDIGTAPNQIPLNQFLGGLAYMDSVAGLDFSATSSSSTGTVTSQILDDYEEGTWTPTSETGTIDYTSAKYTKIGNIVHLNVYIDNWSNITSDAVVQIQSLPYAGENTDANVGSVMYRYINDTDGIGGDLALFMANGNSLRFYFQNSVGDSNYAALKHKDINGNTSSFRIQMTYRAA
jgi:hypothetical protein